jgi:Cu-Zn family superoxide dismutase
MPLMNRLLRRSILVAAFSAGSLAASAPGLAAAEKLEEKLDEKLDTAPVIVDAVELIAVLKPTHGNTAKGTAVFKQRLDGKVEVAARIEGLTPAARCNLRIHEFGDLSSANGAGAGGPYPPLAERREAPAAGARNAGDFGDVEANSSGVAELRLVVDDLSLAGRKNPIIGRALIIQASRDTRVPLATGVIGVRQLPARNE